VAGLSSGFKKTMCLAPAGAKLSVTATGSMPVSRRQSSAGLPTVAEQNTKAGSEP